jgi:hypothetical protein
MRGHISREDDLVSPQCLYNLIAAIETMVAADFWVETPPNCSKLLDTRFKSQVTNPTSVKEDE